MYHWLFGKNRFRFYEDSYARTKESAFNGLKAAIQSRSEDAIFLLVAHFPQRFEEIQAKLHEWELDYEIVNKAVSPEQLVRNWVSSPQRLWLGLSSLFHIEEKNALHDENSIKVCVIGTERHPNLAHDQSLEQFCRQIPAEVELGYFLSFEDTVVKNLVNEASLKILDLFGMGQNELITSNMISRRLRNVLAQNQKRYHTDQTAESAAQWLQKNDPGNAI